MAITNDFEFEYIDRYPYIRKNTLLDGEVIDSSVIDIPSQYEQLSTETLQNFSNFLVSQFTILTDFLITEGLNQYKFNELVDPIKVLCRFKTSCDDIIYERNNPSQNENPFPPA